LECWNVGIWIEIEIGLEREWCQEEEEKEGGNGRTSGGMKKK
jgi:hypothetical protein